MVEAAGVAIDSGFETGPVSEFRRKTKRDKRSIRSKTWLDPHIAPSNRMKPVPRTCSKQRQVRERKIC